MIIAALLTGFTVIYLVAATSAHIVSGVRWWLRPSASLVIRIPGFLLALFCSVVGALFTYNVNLWVVSNLFFTKEAGRLYFRFWVLFFLPLAPVALLVTSLGFTVPLMCFFVLIPSLYRERKLGAVARIAVSTLVAVANYCLFWLASTLFP